MRQTGRITKALRLLLPAVAVLFVFAGQRCERRPQGKPTVPLAAADAGETGDAQDGEDAAEDDGEGDDAPAAEGGEPDAQADVDGTAEGAADAAQDAPGNEEAAAPAVVFKKVPKIPSIKPSPQQPVASPEEVAYLSDHEKTCTILSESVWVKKEGQQTLEAMRRQRVNDPLAWRFKILMGLEGEDETVTGFFKPRQEQYWDWLREVHAYAIGRMIGAPTVPTVLRFFHKKQFGWWLGKQLPEEITMFVWEDKKDPKIRGALKYWVPSYYHRRIGHRIADEEYMTEIAAALHPANKGELEARYGVYLELGRGIVFDYLILNEDRPENLGTILLADGSYRIVLIDNGLSLGVDKGGRTVMKKMFNKMRLFPRDMIDRIREMKKEEVAAVLCPPGDKPMCLSDTIIAQLWKRRDYILSTVDKWHAAWGDIVWY